MTDAKERLREIWERAEKATPGAWKLDIEAEYGEFGSVLCYYPYGGVSEVEGKVVEVFRFRDDYGNDQGADGEFIAHAREDIPFLLAEVTRLMERESKAEAMAAGLDALMCALTPYERMTAMDKAEAALAAWQGKIG